MNRFADESDSRPGTQAGLSGTAGRTCLDAWACGAPSPGRYAPALSRQGRGQRSEALVFIAPIPVGRLSFTVNVHGPGEGKMEKRAASLPSPLAGEGSRRRRVGEGGAAQTPILVFRGEPRSGVPECDQTKCYGPIPIQAMERLGWHDRQFSFENRTEGRFMHYQRVK